jgi:hypothetical protein
LIAAPAVYLQLKPQASLGPSQLPMATGARCIGATEVFSYWHPADDQRRSAIMVGFLKDS